MDEVLLITVGVIFVVVIVGSYLLAAILRRRFISWILARVRRSMSWIGRGEPLTGKGLEEERFDRRAMFDVMEGRNTEAPTPPKRTGARPAKAGTAIEDLQDRDRK